MFHAGKAMLSRTEANLLNALKTRSGREKHGAFVIEGVRVVEAALDAGVDLKFAAVSPTLEDSKRGRALMQRVEAGSIVRRVSDSELRHLSDTETQQGIVAVARAPRAELPQLKLPERCVVLVLDAIQDPGNLGTLIRTADAFATVCVIALPGTVDYWNPKVVRAAAGATFHLPLIGADESQAFGWLAQNGFIVCGAHMTGLTLDQVHMPLRIALVVGNEGGGLRKETRARVTQTVAIPMPGNAESLNVAAAAAILLYELSRGAQ